MSTADRPPPFDAAAAIAALLDRHRLMIAGALVDHTRDADELAGHTGLPRGTVLQAVGVLRQVGLVEPVDGGYRLPAEQLRRLAEHTSEGATPMDPIIGYGMSDAERDVLERFFRGRTLERIPTDRPKRLVVLERLALEFDVGRRYVEAEVDAVLRAFHLDVASLRRHLVDEGMLSRERSDGQTRYWRSGGRVAPLR